MVLKDFASFLKLSRSEALKLYKSANLEISQSKLRYFRPFHKWKRFLRAWIWLKCRLKSCKRNKKSSLLRFFFFLVSLPTTKHHPSIRDRFSCWTSVEAVEIYCSFGFGEMCNYNFYCLLELQNIEEKLLLC